MREIRLNGALGAKYGRRHRFDVVTAGEAFRALGANYPGFTQELANSARLGVKYVVKIDGVVKGVTDPDEPFSRSMSITPALTGSGPVMAAFYLAVNLVAYGGTTVVGSAILSFAANVGVALVLTGVAKLLAPQVSKSSAAEKMESAYFNGPAQTVAQGGPVPVGYGRLIVGSAVISSAITVEDKPPPVAAEDVPIGGMIGNLVNGLMR